MADKKPKGKPKSARRQALDQAMDADPENAKQILWESDIPQGSKYGIWGAFVRRRRADGTISTVDPQIPERSENAIPPDPMTIVRYKQLQEEGKLDAFLRHRSREG